MNAEMTRHIESQLKDLKLKGILGCYRDIAELLEEELKGRNERSVRAKIYKARVPFVKTLEEIDFSFQPSLGEKEVMRLAQVWQPESIFH